MKVAFPEAIIKHICIFYIREKLLRLCCPSFGLEIKIMRALQCKDLNITPLVFSTLTDVTTLEKGSCWK